MGEVVIEVALAGELGDPVGGEGAERVRRGSVTMQQESVKGLDEFFLDGSSGFPDIAT